MSVPYDHTRLEPFYSAVSSPEEAARYNYMVVRVVDETGYFYAPFEPIHVGSHEVWLRRASSCSPGGCVSAVGEGAKMALGEYRLRYEAEAIRLKKDFPIPERE